MQRIQKRIGEILLEKGLINREKLEEALKEQNATGEFLGKILIKHRWITEKIFLSCLSEQFRIPLVTLKDKYIDWKLLETFSPTLILDYKCIPLKKEEEKVVFVINNPLDVWKIKKIEEEVKGLRVELNLALENEIEEVISRYKEYLRSKRK